MTVTQMALGQMSFWLNVSRPNVCRTNVRLRVETRVVQTYYLSAMIEQNKTIVDHDYYRPMTIENVAYHLRGVFVKCITFPC